ncbi:MAG: hypothetical protein ACFB6R_13770 [Alphaproteobacteria bacterium]
MRPFVGLLAGVIAGILVTAFVEAVGHAMFPTPPGVRLTDEDSLAPIVEQVPMKAVAVLVAWGLGVFVGASVAFKVAEGAEWPGWAVVIMLLAGAGWMLLRIQPPVWMSVTAVLLMPAAAYAAARMFRSPGLNGPGSVGPA